jgi:WD40 repeat protein
MRLGQFNSRTPSVILLGRRRELPRFEGYVAVFSPDGRQVLTGSTRLDETRIVGEAILWDVATGQKLRTFEGHRGSVCSVAFSPDGRYVLTGSGDGTARLWKVE